MSDSPRPNQRPAPGAKPAMLPLGGKMPAPATEVPVLQPPKQEPAAQLREGHDAPRCEIANGLSFVGDAVLAGVCTVRGTVKGSIRRADGSRIAVIVAETGFVKGDIVADQISIMGRTEGLLDASGGNVALHESADVSGHVRYHRIQVNGSELNATLERAPAKEPRDSSVAQGAAAGGMESDT